MSDSAGGTIAGWYPDPWDSQRQRYWDGAQWTEHVYPGAPLPAARPKRRRGLVIGLVTGGVAVVAVLALVAAFVVVPAVSGPQAAVYTDRSTIYDYTDEMLGLERDHEFRFDVDYDLDAVNAAHAEASGLTVADGDIPGDWALQVYYDSALTKPADFFAFQSEPGDDVTVSGDELGVAFGGNAPDDGLPIMDEQDESYGDYKVSDWGLHEEYYLVNRIEKDGTERAKPLVTRFTVTSELAAPDVTFSDPGGDGTVNMSWTPIEGATEYLIIVSSDSTIEGGGESLVAEVEGTQWSSSTEVRDVVETTPWVDEQNVNLKAFDYRVGSEDWPSEDPDEVYDENTKQSFDIGVIATDGSHYSPYKPYDLAQTSGALPYEVAFNASRDLKKWGASGYIEGIENVQTVLPFTSIDGRTRTTVAYIDPVGTVEYDDRWVVPLRGRGTLLGEWVPITKRSTPDLAGAIAQFNAAAEAAAPPTGMPRFSAYEPPADAESEPLSEAPPTDYPVYGSTELTKYIAQHMIAQTTSIDISAFVDVPGAPDPYDAAYEAEYQNPYVMNVNYVGLRDGGKTLLITYAIPTEEVKTLQASLKQRIDEVVGAVTTEDMTAAQKVTALNDWLVGNATYDDAAFAALQADPSTTPLGYESAWNATGTLLKGTGVCASYAYAFNALANAAGVQTVVVSGDVLSGGAHAWNKSLIDGSWLAVDTTWNDGGGDPATYLMIPDSGFTGDAERVEGPYWMIDSSIPAYATP
ncbi:transglutaminase domain-containing protein [Herbiconiux liangxiaofengii]|uniref:transglutaminase domain-containing protein n=1 Tax=Herbiconiux liangxiaofengii TaxID=3342795 RepID=UPI0035B98E09